MHGAGAVGTGSGSGNSHTSKDANGGAGSDDAPFVARLTQALGAVANTSQAPPQPQLPLHAPPPPQLLCDDAQYMYMYTRAAQVDAENDDINGESMRGMNWAWLDSDTGTNVVGGADASTDTDTGVETKPNRSSRGSSSTSSLSSRQQQ